jgi:predicted metalloprotease
LRTTKLGLKFSLKTVCNTKKKIVLFENVTQSGCGTAQSSMGPFYCPADQTVYMDMSFFGELQSKFGAKATEFTVAYVMAHEIGHHIQTLLGTTQKVDQQRRSGQYSEAEMNKISVATELQADFLLVFGQNKPITENIS